MKKTVTIGAAALNEEANIVQSVSALLKQTGSNFVLKEVIIASDGSTDKTVELLKAMNDERVKILDFKERKGQLKRMLDVINAFESDYFIFTDADIVFENTSVVEKLVTALEEQDVAMACGRAKPLEGQTFVERAVRNTHLAYEDWAKDFQEGNNVYNVHGCILAFNKAFIKSVAFPEEVTVADVYCYYTCKTRGLQFRFVPEAAVLIRVSNNIKDHLKQIKRYMSSGANVERYFDRKLIANELNVPKRLKYRSFIKTFVKSPISCMFIFVINKYAYIKVKRQKANVSSMWELATSTKKDITV
ncbi:MAG: hypothetical protein RLY61_875 [Candidatus Parcubacteria bacterium]|jgi:glycosyltransferase involved in cell wall biosynthesis